MKADLNPVGMNLRAREDWSEEIQAIPLHARVDRPDDFLCCAERTLPARRIAPVARQRFEDSVGIGEERPQALNDQTFESDRWQALARVAADFPVSPVISSRET